MVYKSRWTVPIPEHTLPSFLFNSPTAKLSPDPLFIDAERPDRYVLTADDFRLWAQRLAAGLRAAGLKPGEAVMFYTGNNLFFPSALVGTVMAGGIFTAANPGYNAREVAYQLNNSDAKFLVVAEAALETGLAAAKEAGLDKKRLFVLDDGYDTFDGKGKGKSGCEHWSALLASEEEGRRFEWADKPSMVDDTICLNYSSGTTGLPKGVEITHRNYVSNALQHMHLITLRDDYEKTKGQLRWLCFTPMYHAMSQTLFCVGAPSKNIRVYIMRKFDFKKMLEAVQQFRVTDLQLVPPIVVAMTKSELTRQYDLSSVAQAGSGAAPLGGEISAAFNKLWPKGVMNLKQGYGMTEVTCSVLGWDPNKHSDSFGVGEPNANTEIKIVDPSSLKEVNGHEERGELWVRGPNVMKGYWKNDKATKETVTSDGWLRTGDIATIDEHGCVYIVDRMKELIKVKGNQVAPAELESQLLHHEGIADAAVVGVPHGGDEAPRAYVVLAPGSKITPEEVVKYMQTKVSKHKQLTGGARIVKEIAKNPSGKILRKELRAQAAKEMGAKL